MGIETATPGYISDLDKTWPLGNDPRSQGDDHIRFIKNVLKNVFPGALGQGFNTPIVATEAELNFLDGVTSNIQTQLNAIAASTTNKGAFKFSKSVPQPSFPVGGAFFQLIWGTSDYDNKTGKSANSYIIPVGQGGVWHFGLSVSDGGNNTDWSIRIRKNTTTLLGRAQKSGAFNMSNVISFSVLAVVSDGDSIDTAAQCLAGIANEIVASDTTTFWGFKVI